MGKKTLEEVGRILLISFITIIITLVTARRTLLDAKLSKTDYEIDQKLRWEGHDKEQRKNDFRNEKTYEMVLFLYQKEKKWN